MTEHVIVPVCACPRCKAKMDAVTPMSGKRLQMPKPGDFTLCSRCFALLRFNAELGLAAATTADLDLLTKEQRETLGNAARMLWAQRVATNMN